MTTTISPARAPRPLLLIRDPDTDAIVLIAATPTRLGGVGGVEDYILLGEVTSPGLAKTIAHIQANA